MHGHDSLRILLIHDIIIDHSLLNEQMMDEMLNTHYEKRAVANMASLLTKARNCLIEGANSHDTAPEHAAEKYNTVIAIINVYFQHAAINNQIGNPSYAFCYRGEASYCLAILRYKKNNLETANSLFMKATEDNIKGLRSTPDVQVRREVYYKSIKNTLLYLRDIFKKNSDIVDSRKYLSEYLPLIKEELRKELDSGEEGNKLKKVLKKFEDYFVIPVPPVTHFWSTSHSLQTDSQNNSAGVSTGINENYSKLSS